MLISSNLLAYLLLGFNLLTPKSKSIPSIFLSTSQNSISLPSFLIDSTSYLILIPPFDSLTGLSSILSFLEPPDFTVFSEDLITFGKVSVFPAVFSYPRYLCQGIGQPCFQEASFGFLTIGFFAWDYVICGSTPRLAYSLEFNLIISDKF